MLAIWRPVPNTGRPVRFRFTPTELQEEFHVARKRIVLDLRSNRLGKSTSAFWEIVWRANGVHPYKHVPLVDTIWSGFPNYPFYEKVTLPIFREHMPRSLLLDWSESKKRAVIRRVDGGTCSLYYVSYDQDPDDWAGASVGYFHADEMIPREHWSEAMARLADTGGDASITLTPVKGLDWISDELYLPGITGERRDVEVLTGGLAEYDEALEKRDPESYGVKRTRLPRTHPMGTVEAVRNFARSYKDPVERKIRVFGILGKQSGGVYMAFDPEVHVIPAFSVPEHFEVWGGLDPGFHGFAAVTEAMDPMGRQYTVHEFFSAHETTQTRLGRLWQQLLDVLPWLSTDPEREITYYVDTAEQQEILELNERAQEIGARLVFVALDQKLKAIDAGVQRIRNQLEPSTLRATPPHVKRARPEQGEPLIYLFDTLHSAWVLYKPGMENDEGEPMEGSRLAWEFRHFRMKKTGPNQAHSAGPDNNSAGGAHMLAAKRYASMSRLQPPGEPSAPRDEGPRERRAREHRERIRQRVAEAEE